MMVQNIKLALKMSLALLVAAQLESCDGRDHEREITAQTATADSGERCEARSLDVLVRAGTTCVQRQSAGFTALIQASAWREQPLELDRLREHRPLHVSCKPFSYHEERGALELSTQDCNYFSLEQPSQLAIRRGATIELALSHFDLLAKGQQRAHVAVSFAGEVQWERYIPIPRPAHVIRDRFQATRALATTDAIALHLHNHGQNVWRFEQLIRVDP